MKCEIGLSVAQDTCATNWKLGILQSVRWKTLGLGNSMEREYYCV